MPELIEVELYRTALDPLIGETVDAVELLDSSYLRPRGVRPDALEPLVGRRVGATDRIGKLLLVDLVGRTDDAVTTVGLRFGMTGRLLIDGVGPIERLEYSSGRNDPSWDRVVFVLGGRRVSIRDPRRLGSVALAPDTSRIGPDATRIDVDDFVDRVHRRTAPIKTVLLNQEVVSGLGNLLADEILWEAGVSPRKAASSLDGQELAELHAAMCTTISTLTTRGGSHTGDLFGERHVGGVCPRDGADLANDTVGGRGAWWCPHHQR